MIKRIINFLFPNLRRDRLVEAWAKYVAPHAKPVPPPQDNTPVYVAGLFNSHAGVAVGARAQMQHFINQGRKVYGIDLTQTLGQASTVQFDGELNTVPPSGTGILVIHQNPPYFIPVLAKMPRKFLRDKYIVGYWAWELEKLPDWWHPSLDYLHEIWVPSQFVRNAVAAATDKPVKVVPHAVNLQPETARPFAADGKIRILYVFDMGSSYARKNPMAAIAAFRQAFGDRNDVELVIKAARPDIYPPGWQELINTTANLDNVKLIRKFMTDGELSELYRSADIYLSLHRSEGFGLTIFDAMNLGLQVVATGWSGNLDFMTGPRCHAVKYTLIPVIDPQKIYPYPGCRWAEPDIDHAAGILRQLTVSIK